MEPVIVSLIEVAARWALVLVLRAREALVGAVSMALHVAAGIRGASVSSLLPKLGLGNRLGNGLVVAIRSKHALVTRLEKLLRRHHHLVIARRTVRCLALVNQVEEVCLVGRVLLASNT